MCGVYNYKVKDIIDALRKTYITKMKRLDPKYEMDPHKYGMLTASQLWSEADSRWKDMVLYDSAEDLFGLIVKEKVLDKIESVLEEILKNFIRVLAPKQV